jgi:predicted nucleotidyltransferase
LARRRALPIRSRKSDTDFQVQFEFRPDLTALRQYFDFAEATQDLLGTGVDLVSGEIRNPYLQATIDKDRALKFEIRDLVRTPLSETV